MKFIFTILSLLISISSQATTFEGNSAGAWVCRDQTSKVLWIEVVDLFEGTRDLNLNIVNSSLPPKDQLQALITKLDRAGATVAFYQILGHTIEHSMDLLELKDNVVLPIVDADLYRLPAPTTPCTNGNVNYEQIANYSVFGAFTVNKSLYELLNPTQQAAVILHHALQMQFIEAKQIRDTLRLRQMVAYAFSDLAPIQYMQNFNYDSPCADCDLSGLATIRFEAEYADSFRNGLARIKKDGKFGFINTKGEIVLPFVFDSAGYPGDDAVYVEMGGFRGYVNYEGKQLFAASGWASEFDNGYAILGKEKLVDINGKTIFASNDTLYTMAEGMISFIVRGQSDFKLGYYDLAGNVTIPAQFERVSVFRDGVARVVSNGRVFYIDKNGQELIDGGTGSGSDERIAFLNLMKGFVAEPVTGLVYIDPEVAGYYTAAGSNAFSRNTPYIRTTPQFGDKEDSIVDYSEGIAAVYDGEITYRKPTGDYWYFVDLNGQPITTDKYSAVGPFAQGVAPACKNQACFYINKNGRQSMRVGEKAFSFSKEGFSLIQTKKKFGYVKRSDIRL